jgi:hypothetical protein
MAEAPSEAIIPKVNYKDGGHQSSFEEISHVKYNGTISLTINDFIVWCDIKEQCKFKSSPVEFVFGQKIYKFLLQIEPNRKDDEDIGVYLRKLNPEDVNLDFELNALDTSGNFFQTNQAFKKLSSECPAWGFASFLSKESLKEKAKTRLPKGALKLKCNFTIYVDEISSIENEGSSLCSNMYNLLTEGFLQDFNIKCEGKDFLCHQAILATRSDVFKAMLTTESDEKKKGEVEIKDCSADTIPLLLEFMYTDFIDDDRDYNSTELLILADKYQVVRLKNKCQVALSKTVDKNNAIQLLSIASLYSAKVLMLNAAKVVANNIKELVGSEDWKQMVATNPQAMEAIIKNSL